MNYEEKYNKALEVMRQWIAPCHTKEQLDTLKKSVFPELAESEDERIRSRIIDGFKNFSRSASIWNNIPIEEVIAYLEKQKEQKEELVYRLNGLMQDYIKEGKNDEEKEHRLKCYQLFWDALEDTNFFEQKEQKPAEWSAPKINGEPIPTENYSVNIPLAEWSEEDKEMLKDIISGLKAQKLLTFAHDNQGKAQMNTRIDWLQSLPERFNPQPKPEWSEEDEKMLSDLRNTLGCLMNAGAITFKTKKKFSNWLKSLRPSWKPSEEEQDATRRK